ncbi:MAG: DNA cytosine methyltransferase [Brevundimonas sp.]|uniref:DNA cytosine methyltransferase n=1 Tax=Brevundimonas sp. TaxID=1871086 RepID=UPI00271CD60B|nr:DNA cytosine methyltransferase [Brevundimonas sp.]MDO9586386.1 DNA cytosine methyltransferase [Brevundimonas sp.]MDP3657212.1 DNA cytosine methyltransferase [Brevundimonas sp.]MDZ4110539.1 DNA cytosine methyltransferase [Brevundimonas sp.]
MTTFVSIFSGAGGLDIGLQRAGWDCLYATDFDRYAVETLKLNAAGRFHGGGHIRQADIRNLAGDEILSEIGRRRGDVDLLAGGPPCQSWSSAGHQLGFNDPRGRLFEDYLRVAKQLDVRWLLFENVRGLITARGPDGLPGSALAAIRQALFSAGWQTRVELLNAADFGAPQRRVRVVLIGYRQGDEPPVPTATHHERGEDGKAPWISMDAALASLSPLGEDEIIRPSGKLAVELEAIPPGSGVKSPGKRETTRPGGHWGYKQGAFVADLRRPARTVTANAQQDWIRDPVHGLRRLSPRECAALQSFPADWVFAGKRVDQYRQIGNAVPPLLAEQIGRALGAHVIAAPALPDRSATAIAPLPARLQAAIDYTTREHRRNGASRSAAPSLRRIGDRQVRAG